MDKKTKYAAMIKLTAMKLMVAYPDEMLDRALVDEHFKDLVFNGDSYFKNWLKMSLLVDRYKASLLRKPVDPDDWIERSTVSLWQFIKVFKANTNFRRTLLILLPQ